MTHYKEYDAGSIFLMSKLSFFINLFTKSQHENFVEFMKNVYAESHNMLQSFKTYEEYLPDTHVIMHNLLQQKTDQYG